MEKCAKATSSEDEHLLLCPSMFLQEFFLNFYLKMRAPSQRFEPSEAENWSTQEKSWRYFHSPRDQSWSEESRGKPWTLHFTSGYIPRSLAPGSKQVKKQRKVKPKPMEAIQGHGTGGEEQVKWFRRSGWVTR